MSPIFIKEYFWKQNISEIHVTVPLKNVHVSKVNIFITEKFIKINFPPYLFQLVLLHSVNPSKAKCIFKENQIIVELRKLNPTMWDSLSRNINGKEYVKFKEEIIHEECQKSSNESQKKEHEKHERKKVLNTYQMNINKEDKVKIQLMKDEEKQKGLKQIADLNFEQKTNKMGSQTKIKAGPNTDQVLELPVPVPFPRSSGSIKFIFSSRILPTPKRKSRTAEEQEWLRKEVEAARASGFVAEELTEDEKNPSWLLDKGKSFLTNENYLAALNVFSHGSKIAPKMPVFYLRMAQTQLKLQLYYEAVENSSKVLELLTPVVPKNKSMRAEAYRTRGEAFKYINEMDNSNADFNSASLLS